MPDTIRVMPHEDGVHWRGVGPEGEALVSELMLAGVAGSPAGYDTMPHDGTLGGFCSEAIKKGYRVEVADASGPQAQHDRR